MTQSRPDVAYDNCIVGNSISKATTQTIIQANKAVRKARTHEVSLNYPSHFNISSSKIVGYTDSSFGNLPDGGSQGAFIIFLCDQKGKATLIMWQSRRIRRAVNSTLAAECIAAVEAAEACAHLQKLVHEMMYRGNTHNKIPISILCDNRSFSRQQCIRPQLYKIKDYKLKLEYYARWYNYQS